MAVAADVPGIFDCVINGQGYVFLDSIEPSLPFRTHRAIYEISKTFVTRQNVSGAYGDNQQEFWLTASQNDWSEGEGQHFFRSTDTDRIRQYWQGQNVDVTTPGKATLRNGVTTTGALGTATAQVAGGNTIYFTTATNLKSVAADGTITDLGAHGVGAAPTCMAYDGNNVYMSARGFVVRRWNVAIPAFSTFSTGSGDAMAFLNNTLFVLNNATARLYKFDTAGTATILYTWQDAHGTALAGTSGALRAWGKNLLIMWTTISRGAELWQYDGSGTSLVAQLPPDFYAADVDVAFGGIFVGGSFLLTVPTGSTAGTYYPAVLYYINGNYGELWRSQSPATAAAGTAVADLNHAFVDYFYKGLAFVDPTTNQLMSYDISTGTVSSIADTTGYTKDLLVDGAQAFIAINNRTNMRLYPSTTTVSSGFLATSAFDFESSLDKSFRAVKIEATIPAGASIDLAYQLNDVTGSYTSLATGITPGVDVPINQSGRSISIKVTLNKGSSSSGPTLKRIYIRAAPVQLQFKGRQYVLDLTGTAGQPRKGRDGSYLPKSGRQMANDLIVAAQTTTPFSITDRLGTFTGLVDNDAGFELYEIHPSVDEPGSSGGFVARVNVREV